MILVPKSYDVLTEAYYGKPKEFEYIEGELAKIIDMIDDIFDGRGNHDINSSEELKNIERTFTKVFKVKETAISFYSPNPISGVSMNAFTIPSSFTCFNKDSSNKKLADPKNLFINVNVDIGLVHALELTPKELMAIILHEIGHCFDASVMMFLSNISISARIEFDNNGGIKNVSVMPNIIGTIMNMLMSSKPVAAIFNFINKGFSSLLAKIPALQTVWNNFSKGWFSFMHFMSVINTPFVVMTHYPIRLLLAAIDTKNLFGFSGEKFADSFATSYGYGPDAVSAFGKMEKNKMNIMYQVGKKIPVLNIGLDMFKTSGTVLTALLDPHPTHATRIQSQLNKLKRDIADPNLDPRVRKMIEQDIKEIEDFIDNDFLNMEENAKEGEVFSTALNAFIIKSCDGKIDPREIISVGREL